ncbi:MAG TPA: hypothetical protein VF484_00700 [Candidatus Limnocylindrales bacterium]
MSSIKFEPTPVRPAAARFHTLRYIGIVASVALGVGTMLPWIVATDQNLGVTVSRPGIDAGSSGLTVLVFAFATGIALFVSTRVAVWVSTICAVVALLLSAADLAPSQDLISYLGLPGEASVGFGLWVSIVSAIVIAAVSAYGAYALRDT